MTAFKTIKYVDNLPDGWEMNQECTYLRKNNKELAISADKIELEATNGIKKLFGVRTLYWSSWGCAPARFPSKKGKNAPVKQVVAKKLSNSLNYGNKQLLSNYMANKVRALIEKRGAMKCTGQEMDDGKSFSVRVLIHDYEKSQMLIRIYSQNWRDGLWFYHPETAKYVKFVHAVHKTGKGDVSIVWPTLVA